MKRYFLLILTVLLPYLIFAQSHKLKKADELFEKFAYSQAVEEYEQIARDGNADHHVIRRLADCYRLLENPEQAEYWYSLVIESDEYEPIALYYYAQALKSNEKYETAMHYLSEYAKIENDDSRAQREIEERKKLQTLLTDSSSVIVRNLIINSENMDWGPMYYKDKIVFSSAREEAGITKRIYAWDNEPFLDLYIAERQSNGELKKPEKLSDKINSKYHEGPVTYNSTGNIMYFTRNNYYKKKAGKSKDDVNHLKIYKAILIGDEWGNIEELPFNSEEYSVGHPSLTADGKTLYFVSDMPDGYGNGDIYRIEKTADGWGEPQNLGPEINTEGNEMFPFIHQNGTLYFASDGLVGLGGLDVFSALPDPDDKDSLFYKPVNLGSPINSPKDDFALILGETLQSGYFSSNRRKGVGSDDIYYFKILAPILLIPKEPIEIQDTMELIAENPMDTTEIFTNPNDDPENSENFETMRVPIDSITPDTELKVGMTIALPNIYYDFDKWNIRRDAAKELDKVVKLLNQHKEVNIELSSHTDCRGSDAYNEKLSHKRAVSAMMYLVEKGISPDRMTAKGYGEYKLVNECADGVKCSEAKHQMNRRTEFTISSISKKKADK